MIGQINAGHISTVVELARYERLLSYIYNEREQETLFKTALETHSGSA